MTVSYHPRDDAVRRLRSRMSSFWRDTGDKPEEMVLPVDEWLLVLDHAVYMLMRDNGEDLRVRSAVKYIKMDMKNFKYAGVSVGCVGRDGVLLNLDQALKEHLDIKREVLRQPDKHLRTQEYSFDLLRFKVALKC